VPTAYTGTESGKHEKRTGQRDENLTGTPRNMVEEKAGKELPQ